MKLNLLTNPDPNRQEKMRFFTDYFLFVNEYLGKVPDIPFDNPYSLLDKIIYQIEHNPDNFPIYIGNHFKQFFSFDTEDSDGDTLTIKALYKNYSLQKKKKEWVNANPSFIKEIKRLHLEYKTKLFDDNFSSLFSFINCIHTLNQHENAIKYSVQILVSQFRLNGYSKEHVDSAIDRILSKDNFPFPPEISAIKDNLKREKAEKIFLEKRDFKEQFLGLKNMLTRSQVQKGTFIYSIENCSLETKIKDSFKIKFDYVTFISPTHSSLSKLKESIFDSQDSDRLKEIFFGDNILLALVTLNYDILSFAKVIGLTKVKNELQQFNNYINGELKLNVKHYLFTKKILME